MAAKGGSKVVVFKRKVVLIKHNIAGDYLLSLLGKALITFMGAAVPQKHTRGRSKLQLMLVVGPQVWEA